MRRCVWSRNLKNEEAMTRVGPQRHMKKKNNNMNCSNDRDNTLFWTTYEILSNLFSSSLTWYVEEMYWDRQCGFQRNRLTTDKILCFADRASRYFREMKTNLMHYLCSVYFFNQPLHVPCIFVAHHQEVYCIYIYIYTTIGTCYRYTVYLLMMGYRYARNM